MSTMYECGACRLWKVAADFFRDVRYTDRWMPRSTCKACMKAKRKAVRVHWTAKVCTGCNQMVPLSGFYIQASSPHMPCKACRAGYQPSARVVVSEKRCARCGIVKPVDQFNFDTRKSNGRASACRLCQNAYRPLVITVPAEKRCSFCKTVKPATDFYRTDKSRDGLYARCKDCHNERAAPGQQRYRELNQERVAEWFRTWAQDHPENMRLKGQVATARRRARKHAVESTFTREQWAAMKAAYNNCCAYCGKPCERLTMDHVIPLARGGPHVAANIVPACRPCNSRKHLSDADAFIRRGFP